jgi:class 3 adenylate cyclase/CHAT domain-containing protein/tetratricopeptide (TPR) repeat protein
MPWPEQPTPSSEGSGQPTVPDRPEGESTNIEALLRERSKIDDLLQRQFRHEVTLLFTDIRGSTSYFERWGDLSGRQMVQRHNDLLFPLIAQQQGTILKTIGDAIMASFAEPASAVQAAMAMQQALRDYNRDREAAEQIHIRIGINSGRALVEPHDVFGDVVNAAARVESCALPDQILISEATYHRLPTTIPCRLLGAKEVKGKSVPIQLYEVLWDDLNTVQETVLLRGAAVTSPQEKVLVLEVSREEERLKLSAYERWSQDERPIKRYEYLAVSFVTVQHAVETLVASLSRANRRGTLGASVWEEIKTRGESLYRQLLTPSIRERLSASEATHLFLYIDDTLVQIPWELLFDGQTFLCRRFSIGRIVRTQQLLVEGQAPRQGPGITMLIVADPQGNLEAAAREGSTIREVLEAEQRPLQVDLRSTDVRAPYLKEYLSRYDVLHYAGHADYDVQDPAQSGWLTADGKLTAADVLQMAGAAPMPALVFCNACRSGQTEAWKIAPEVAQGIYGLANAFLLAGTRQYIGTFWEIPDEPSRTFAIDFYRTLAQGATVGQALRGARQAVAARYGEDSVVWASYVLYGDPTSRLAEPTPESIPSARQRVIPPTTSTRAGRRRPVPRKIRLALGTGALFLIMLCVALVGGRFWTTAPANLSPLMPGYQALERGDWPEADALFQQLAEQLDTRVRSQGYAGMAALALARRDYQQALALAGQAEALDPEIAYSHVIRGHLLLNQEKVAEAILEYRTATEKANGAPWQQAIAHNHLGRIYAAQGDTQQALHHYDRAISQYRQLAVTYANKGHLLAQLGKPREALSLYRQALQLDPADRLTEALLREAEQREQFTQDRQKQERIDQLVSELVRLSQEGKRRESPGDGWTSRPLTLAFLAVQTQGTLPPRAGEGEFLFLRMAEGLSASGRIAIVERAILDRLLEELKLSASDLTDPQLAVRIGRILAARLIATGTLTRFGDEGRLGIRVIETETTRIKASTVEPIELSRGIDGTVDRVSSALLQQLHGAYPLQARIAQVTPQGIIVNIGAEQGMTPGRTLQVFGAEEPIEIDGKIVGYRGLPIGLIEVTNVEATLSQARVLEQTTPFQTGWKVKEVQRN